MLETLGSQRVILESLTLTLSPCHLSQLFLYRISYHLTYRMLQLIHLVCIDGRTQNLYVLAGHNEEIEFEVTPNGEVL
jgi:hypothetical protein